VRKSYDVMLAYWVLVILIAVFIILGGYLDFESGLVTLSGLPASIPFTWLMTPLIVLGIVGTYLAWVGYPLKGLPELRGSIAQHNPLRREEPAPRVDQEAE
jgi:hypothetical protein